MAIYHRCSVCKNDFKTSKKVCPKCKTPVPKDGRLYKIMRQVAGQRITRFSNNYELAEKIEADIKKQLDSTGVYIDPRIKETSKILADVWARYLADASTDGVKAWERDQDRYEQHLGPAFGHLALDKITPDLIEKFKARMLKTKSRRDIPYAPATVWNMLELLRRLFNFAIRLDLFKGTSPLASKRVRFPRVNNAVDAALPFDALRPFLDACDAFKTDPGFGAFCRFLVTSGCRRSEAIGLTWDDIDLGKRQICLPDTKAGRRQHVELNDGAIVAIQAQAARRVEGDRLVFPGLNGKKRTNTDKPWQALKRAAGLPAALRLHDLRHTFASVLAASGQVDAPTLQKLLRHSDPRMTARYTHYFPGALQKAAGVLDAITRKPDEDPGRVVNLDERRRRKA